MLLSLVAQNLCTLEKNHHEPGHLAYTKCIQNFKKKLHLGQLGQKLSKIQLIPDQIQGFGQCAEQNEYF